MMQPKTVVVLLAMVMLTGAIAGYSVLSADDERQDHPRADRAAERERLEAERDRLRALDEAAAAERRERLLRRQLVEDEERLRRFDEAAAGRARQTAQRDRLLLAQRARRDRQPPGLDPDAMRARARGPDRPPMAPPDPPFRPEYVQQYGHMIELIERMKHVCFDPENAALIAVGGLKDDIPRRPEEVVDDLEGVLKRTRTLGVRNAVRMVLRDLYRHLGAHDRALRNLHEMLAENDEALHGRRERDEPARAERHASLVAAGDAKFTKARWAEALELYAEAGKLGPSDSLAAKITECRFRIALEEADRLREERNYDEAAKAYEAAAKVKPVGPLIGARLAAMKADRAYQKLVEEGRAALKRQQLDRARERFLQARKIRNTPEVQELIRQTEAKQ